jgi:jumonji domain-containing protein 7
MTASPLNTNLMDTWLVSNHHKVRVNLGESNVKDLRLRDLFPEIDPDHRMGELTLGNNSTWGSSRLREAVAATYPTQTAANVLVTAGVSEAVVVVCLAHHEAGANLIIPVPAFHALIDVPEKLGYEIRRVALRAESDFRLSVSEILAAVDERTRIVLLNSPHNPTGVLYSHDDIMRIADAVRDVGATVIVDEHYRYLPRNTSGEWVRSASGGRENIVTLGSVGKCFGCTGIRVGWIVASAARLECFHHYKLLVTHTIPVLSDYIAAEILERRGELLPETRSAIEANLLSLQRAASRSRGALTLYEPDAGSVAFVGLEHVPNTFEFAQTLLDESGIVVLPGESFELPGFLRLRLGIPPAEFARGLAAIETMLERTPPAQTARTASDTRIPRVSSSRFSAEFAGGNTPAIITDALEDWRVAERWTPQSLADFVRHRKVTVSVAHNGRFRYDSTDEDTAANGADARTEMDFVDAVSALYERRREGHVYVMQQSIPERLPELMDHLVVPPWIGSAEQAVINLWFGYATTTSLHYDDANNFFAQVYGRKRFVIFSPTDTACLYPFSHKGKLPHLAHVDPSDPDLERYPDFVRASPLEFELQPGELLYLPAFWWHQVRSAEVSISVSFWWPAQISQYVDSPSAVRRLYGLYEEDRLAGVREGVLAPNQLDFARAAALMLERGRNWAASVLALAAFDEWAAGWYPLPRPRGCALADLSGELETVCARILAMGEIPAQYRGVLEKVPALAGRSAEFDDGRVDGRSVREVIDMLGVGSNGRAHPHSAG